MGKQHEYLNIKGLLNGIGIIEQLTSKIKGMGASEQMALAKELGFECVVNKEIRILPIDKVSDSMHIDLIKAFGSAVDNFGLEFSRNIERLYRKETRNFESLQFLACYSPGMEAVKNRHASFPYGWSSLREFCVKMKIPQLGFKTIEFTENGTGIKKYFIKFPTVESAVLFVCYMVRKRGNIGYWRSLDDVIAKRYSSTLPSFKSFYVDLRIN